MHTRARKVTVTGATGFLGGRLVEALRARGDEVTCLVRGSSHTAALSATGARVVVGDLLDAASLEPGVRGADQVFHLAAQLRTPWRDDFTQVNAEGCGNLARACAAQPVPPVLVLVSSLAAGGPSAGARAGATGAPRGESDAPAPVSRYGAAKLAGEAAARAWADRLPLTIVRPPVVIGPGDRATRPLLDMLRRGAALVPRGGLFSFVHVDELARLLILAAERGERVRPGGGCGEGVYYAAADEDLTLAELARRLAHAGGHAPRVLPLPVCLVALAALAGEGAGRLLDRPTVLNLDKVREARAGGWRCSARKAHDQLGWSHEPLAAQLATAPGW